MRTALAAAAVAALLVPAAPAVAAEPIVPFTTVIQKLRGLTGNGARPRKRRTSEPQPAEAAAVRPPPLPQRRLPSTTAPPVRTPAEVAGPPPPARAPVAAPASAPALAGPARKDWPRVLPTSEPAAASTAWGADDIARAEAICVHTLRRTGAVVTREAPIREGPCGDPAPVRLASVGGVSFEPAPVVNCSMVGALADWLASGLQPLAQKHLKSRITAITVMSSYSCRNAYGRTTTNLSEHGLANAIDIGGFATGDRRQTLVLDHWGPNGRDVSRHLAAVAAEKARVEQARVERALAEKRAVETARETRAAGQRTTGSAADEPATAASDPRASGVGAGALGIAQGGAAGAGRLGDGPAPLSLRGLQPLGGPKADTSKNSKNDKTGTSERRPPRRNAAVSPSAVAASAPELFATIDGPRRRFLIEAHEAACRIFGTVLGPEANEAHRNHFHVDLAARRSGSYCR